MKGLYGRGSLRLFKDGSVVNKHTAGSLQDESSRKEAEVIESYRKLLFADPDYMISNVSKFLGEVSADHQMAGLNLSNVQRNIDAFAAAITEYPSELTGIESTLADLRYAMTKIRTHLQSPQVGFSDKDATMFVLLMHCRYAELIKMAEELDAEMRK